MKTKDIFIFGLQRVLELLRPRYINLHITLHYMKGTWEELTIEKYKESRWCMKTKVMNSRRYEGPCSGGDAGCRYHYCSNSLT